MKIAIYLVIVALSLALWHENAEGSEQEESINRTFKKAFALASVQQRVDEAVAQAETAVKQKNIEAAVENFCRSIWYMEILPEPLNRSLYKEWKISFLYKFKKAFGKELPAKDLNQIEAEYREKNKDLFEKMTK